MTLEEFKHTPMQAVEEEGTRIKVLVKAALPAGKVMLGPGVPAQCIGTFEDGTVSGRGSVVWCEKKQLDHLAIMCQRGLELVA